MSHHLLAEIPSALLRRNSHRAFDARRAHRLSQWLAERGIRATEMDLQAERNRRRQTTKESA